ncbi:hypothetical protein CBF23_015205, partial [Marinomonas agarivorans]
FIDYTNFPNNENAPVDLIRFAEGSEWTLQDIESRVLVRGTDGDDTIVGTAGDERIIGNKGDDTLNGGEGNDTYIYDLGDGNDTISGEASEGIDTLQLTDLNPA